LAEEVATTGSKADPYWITIAVLVAVPVSDAVGVVVIVPVDDGVSVANQTPLRAAAV
jgi:hypothetical protein